ncbi:branched-chain amino acid ABC transporter permease [Halogeometricum pallidum JCM 14848]|uniref:Branched-chain amino acid ABC transporter permease n=1 Tax=Halogeometricum pallidum JCM 14848 TaxID=1227487 RepID=M0D1L0_HALPD|nr:branched-chain amino acid ABC transporter permease [Halogeometricum pallidum]ELZ28758.1 branched-chain amino acid ABC transporter permease [Halogeometricum pallidum JCM 14848]
MSDRTSTINSNEVGVFTALQSVVGRYRVPIGALLLVFSVRPVVSMDLLLGYGAVANSILIWMLFAASFNILLGYTGLLSFGHAMFLGIGAYVTAIGLARFDSPFVLSALVALLVAGVVAYLIARLIAQKGEIYFAMLTLAFGTTAHFVANYDPGGLTGGTTGIAGGAVPAWIETERGLKYVSLGGFQFDWYFFVAAAVFVGLLCIWQLVRSPFGRTLVAIRENRDLARAMGINTYRYKVWAFTLSGVVAAYAGAILEVNEQGATLSLLTVQTSGDVILMTVLGGANYFFGPLAGAFVWLFAEDFLTDFETLVLPLEQFPLIRVDLSGVLSYWQFFLGLLFVVAVVVAPREGIWGLFRSVVKKAVDRIKSERDNA